MYLKFHVNLPGADELMKVWKCYDVLHFCPEVCSVFWTNCYLTLYLFNIVEEYWKYINGLVVNYGISNTYVLEIP